MFTLLHQKRDSGIAGYQRRGGNGKTMGGSGRGTTEGGTRAGQSRSEVSVGSTGAVVGTTRDPDVVMVGQKREVDHRSTENATENHIGILSFKRGGGHFGIDKTFQKTRTVAIWHGQRNRCKYYVKECAV